MQYIWIFKEITIFRHIVFICEGPRGKFRRGRISMALCKIKASTEVLVSKCPIPGAVSISHNTSLPKISENLEFVEICVYNGSTAWNVTGDSAAVRRLRYQKNVKIWPITWFRDFTVSCDKTFYVETCRCYLEMCLAFNPACAGLVCVGCQRKMR